AAGWAAGVVAGAVAWAWAWSAVAPSVVACVVPPHAVRPTAASVPIATARPARTENGRNMRSAFLGFPGTCPVRGFPPRRYGRGLHARATPAGAASRWGAEPRRRRRCGAPGDGRAGTAPWAGGGRAAARRPG